ncbi:MAG TPA: TIGR03087 family PEP-CTERM/XrtA system glycosyltransferase [Ignavibacteria bacterium]|nr:TIGR03087 family PEP-CTERM/XrtA system glycosyltransferase [Ignavibacteria bacterium]
MEPLILLVHRLPYPPNKGDKIRSFNLLKYLSKYYSVYLGTFIDDPYDWKYVNELDKYCKHVYVRPLNKKRSTVKSLKGFISGEALSICYYKDSKMLSWCHNIIEKEKIRKAIVFSSSMAQYIDSSKYSYMKRIIDFVDIDSDKWSQYEKSKSWPLNILYRREARKLLQKECEIAHKFNQSFFVSEAERDMFKQLCNNLNTISHYDNGVDYEYFSCQGSLENPYAQSQTIVFTGAMDYWANINAVLWFTNNIFPRIKKHITNVVFYIVGSNPVESIKDLGKMDGVVVTGRVDDVRPYIQYACLSVAPLRIARGVQNKVLEAMSMGVCIVATSFAIKGLKKLSGDEALFVEDDETGFSKSCIKLLKTCNTGFAESNRQYILKNYNWKKNLELITECIE